MSNGRLQTIRNALQFIKDQKNENPILEFGVFEGYSVSEMIKFLKKENMTNQIVGFDSFAGLPKTEGPWGKGEFSSTYENTVACIKEACGEVDNLTLVQGFFEQTLTEKLKLDLGLKKVALVHIDSDLYLSCCQVLAFIKDLLQDGTILIFDEWDGGEAVAWEEFKNTHNINGTVLSHHENQMTIKINM